MPSVRLTRRTLRDLESIRSYSAAEWNQTTADAYLDDIQSALHRIGDHPALLQLREDVSGVLRFYRVRQHFLVCDFVGGVVYVLAICHAAMDLPERIAEIAPELLVEARLMHERVQRGTE